MKLTKDDYFTLIALAKQAGLAELDGTDIATLIAKLQWLSDHMDGEP